MSGKFRKNIPSFAKSAKQMVLKTEKEGKAK
jgi:hypothetical protein